MFIGRNTLRRAYAVEPLPAICRLRVTELELAGRNLRGAAQHGPVTQRLRQIGCSEQLLYSWN